MDGVQRVRFGDNLVCSVVADRAAHGVLVPPMLIQPLLENALHYGAKTSSMPLRVNVSAAVKDDWLEVVVAGSVREARDLLEAKLPDVVFLDVEMLGEAGLELLASVPDGTQVVFVTAHETYALHAFAAGAIDYLVKPIDIERLAETVRRVGKIPQLLRSKGPHAVESVDEEGDDEPPERAGAGRLGPADVIRVQLPTKGQTAVVTVGEICWIEGLLNFTRVGLRNPGRIEVFKQRLGEWDRQLPPHLFARLGKSFLLQVAAIKQLEMKSREETLVTFVGDLEPLAIGRRAATRLREILSHDSSTPAGTCTSM